MKYRLVTGIVITIALIVAYVLLAPRQSDENSDGAQPTEATQ